MDVDQDVSVVLCINSGSSTLKLAVIALGDADGEERTLARASVEGNGTAALDKALALLAESDARALGRVSIIGHRVAHGGPELVDPVIAGDAVLASLRKVVPLAPLHLPPAIAAIEAARTRYPSLPQVLCFDTAFHAHMPEVARRLPIPDRFTGAGVHRYGFHGLSYEYVMSVLGKDRPERIVIAHLGNGASLVAVAGGRSIDTTMGLTPTGGVIMGTRTGDLDPGVLLYLQREHGLCAQDLERLVDRESGLLAVGGTSDMKTLLERAATDSRSRLAVAMFGYSVRKAIGALGAALGGIDLLVFTGGIGEHAPAVRAEACRGLEAFGCTVRVIATDEDVVIARHAHRLCRSG